MRNPTALGHLRVLDLAGPMGQRCSKLMADMGADVIKVEPPEGDPARHTGPFFEGKAHPEGSLYFLNFNTNKRSITLDLTSRDGRDLFHRLAATADVLVESFAPGYLDSLGVGFKSLRRTNPGLVMTSITPFGQTGPYKDFHGTDLVAQAMGGLMYTQGDDTKAPCAAPCELAYQLTSVHAAYGALAALHHRRKSGRGQQVDVSLYEVMSHLLLVLVRYAFNGDIIRRAGRLITNAPPPSSYFECKDGKSASISIIFPREWQGLMDWMDNEILADPVWEDRLFKYANQDIIVEATQDFVSKFTRDEFVEQAQARYLSAIPINTLEDVVKSPKNRERGYFTKSTHPHIGDHLYPGAPYHFSETPWALHRSAPLLGQHQEEILQELGDQPSRVGTAATPNWKRAAKGDLPLKNVRIADFTRVWAGPFGPRYLAELGAEVIKIETHRFPDGVRDGVPVPEPSVPDINRGKLSVTVDFHTPEGKELLKRLVSISDIVIDNFPTGVLDRRGLGYEVLRQMKPDIIVVAMPGFGNTGPYAKYVAYGQELMACSGLTYLWGYPDSPQVSRAKAYYTDFASAAANACAMMIALECRNETGLGQYIELDQSEAAVSEMGVGLLDYTVNGNSWAPMGNRNFTASPHGCFPCRGEDQWCVIACFTQDQWDNLCKSAGDQPWTIDPRFSSLESRRHHQDELEKAISSWTRERTPYQLMRLLQKAGVPAGVVQSGEQLYRDYHLRARNFIVEIQHPQPWGKIEHTGVNVGLSDTPGRVTEVPVLGQHNEYVFSDLLGLSHEDVRRLEDKKVLY